MSNVYHAPEMQPQPKPEKPRVELTHGARVAANSTMELAAANVNAGVGQGVHYVTRDGHKLNKADIDEKLRKREEVPEFFRMPFWFVYEPFESLVVYKEATMVTTKVTDSDGKAEERVSFDVDSVKEEFRMLLINWYSAQHLPLAIFAGARGFDVKKAR